MLCADISRAVYIMGSRYLHSPLLHEHDCEYIYKARAPSSKSMKYTNRKFYSFLIHIPESSIAYLFLFFLIFCDCALFKRGWVISFARQKPKENVKIFILASLWI